LGSTTVTAIDDQMQIRFKSMFSQYLKVGDDKLNEFIQSIPSKYTESVQQLEDYVVDDINNDIIENRKNLGKAILMFHSKAGTLTSKIKEQVSKLPEKDIKIVFAIHQPNLFAYSGVFKKIVLVENLAKSVASDRIIPLFLVVDHDFMDESWMHNSKLPSIRSSSGILDIRYPMNNSKRWKMICKTEKPNQSLLRYWENQIYTWIKNDKSLTKKDLKYYFGNFEKFWEKVEEAHSISKNYAEFNSFLISKIVNSIWGYNTMFVNLSDLSKTFEHGFEFLISNNKRYSDSLQKYEKQFKDKGIHNGLSSNSNKYSALWLHCLCGSKGFSILNKKENKEMDLTGRCMSCKKSLVLGLGHEDNIKIPDERLNEVSPRAIPILILLSRELKVANYVTGTGGSLGYTMVGKKIFEDLDIKMPLLLLWASIDTYEGFAQKEASRYIKDHGISDLNVTLKGAEGQEQDFWNKIKPLIQRRNEVFSDKESLSILLTELFGYKQEQRKLRKFIKNLKKVDNCMTLKPSIIDYAVNFGIKDIASYWEEGLKENNDFISPILINPKVV
jgi:hypothetical protein